MPHIVTWDDKQSQQELRKRLQYSQDNRKRREYKWEDNETTVYTTDDYDSVGQLGDSSTQFSNGTQQDEVNAGGSGIIVNYTFKNLRFIHAQLSANPPSVTVRPTSSDQGDRKKAQAADSMVRHFLRQYELQELVDKVSLNTLVYGTGFMKTLWDSACGDILEVDEDTGELTLEGDIRVTVPSTWYMYIDPDAETWRDVRYVFEKVLLPFDEALFRFGPKVRKILERNRITAGSRVELGSREVGTTSALQEEKYDAVELYEYWETGLPTNGYLGRHCICDRLGQKVTPMQPNPHRFTSPGAVAEIENDDRLSNKVKAQKIARIPQVARLPYHIFTDIDVPNKVWGRSFIEYTSSLQDTLNRLDATNLDVIKAHGLARLVLPEGAEIMDDALTDSTWDVTRITGNTPPFFAEAPGPMPIVDNFRAGKKEDINDMSGVNPSMFGQQDREQSGFSMQYATNQGNMIRRRLFNKYVSFTEGIHRSMLDLVRKHWTTERTVYVLGKEKAMQAVELKGADIDGGFDIVVEYGASLSLDPMTRREEIMALQPMFEKAGVPPRVSLKMMRLNELDGMYDILELAESRQSEYFVEMLASGTFIEPLKYEDHENMLAWALEYVMSSEFKYLDRDQKALIHAHMDARSALAASENQPPGAHGPGNLPGGSMPPGPTGAPGPLPDSAEMTGEPADNTQIPPLQG